MDYEGCYENIDDFERDGMLLDAVLIFSDLFDECPPERSSASERDVARYRGKERPRWKGWGEVHQFNDLQASMPAVPPPVDLIERLERLDQSSAVCTPDADECTEEMWIAIHIKAAVLLATWMRSGYGDNLRSTHRELETLLHVCSGCEPDYFRSESTMALIRSFAQRVGAELAFRDQDHGTALECMIESIEEYLEHVWDKPKDDTWIRPMKQGAWLPPWLLDAEEQARCCLDGLHESRNVNWPAIIPVLERLLHCFPSHSLFDNGMSEYEQVRNYWVAAVVDAEAQLTPEQLGNLYRGRDDEAAAKRLRAYFLTDELWGNIPERAQTALVRADRALASASHSRYSLIVSDLRIAVEEIFYDNLWKPLFKWAVTQHPASLLLQALLTRPKRTRRDPGLDDYIKILSSSFMEEYLEHLGMPDESIEFLTNSRCAPRDMRELRRVRDQAEHEPGAAIGAAEARALYAKFLGIGCRGVLPELARVPTERRAAGWWRTR